MRTFWQRSGNEIMRNWSKLFLFFFEFLSRWPESAIFYRLWFANFTYSMSSSSVSTFVCKKLQILYERKKKKTKMKGKGKIERKCLRTQIIQKKSLNKSTRMSELVKYIKMDRDSHSFPIAQQGSGVACSHILQWKNLLKPHCTYRFK